MIEWNWPEMDKHIRQYLDKKKSGEPLPLPVGYDFKFIYKPTLINLDPEVADFKNKLAGATLRLLDVRMEMIERFLQAFMGAAKLDLNQLAEQYEIVFDGPDFIFEDNFVRINENWRLVKDDNCT